MQNQNGISLVELILVVVIIASTVLLIASLPDAFMLINKSKHLSLAREIAVKQIEDKRAISYANLVNDTSQLVDPRLYLLPNASGIVKVEDCGASICTNEENVKKVTAVVSWKDNNKIQTAVLSTLIGEGGLNK